MIEGADRILEAAADHFRPEGVVLAVQTDGHQQTVTSLEIGQHRIEVRLHLIDHGGQIEPILELFLVDQGQFLRAGLGCGARLGWVRTLQVRADRGEEVLLDRDPFAEQIMGGEAVAVLLQKVRDLFCRIHEPVAHLLEEILEYFVQEGAELGGAFLLQRLTHLRTDALTPCRGSLDSGGRLQGLEGLLGHRGHVQSQAVRQAVGDAGLEVEVTGMTRLLGRELHHHLAAGQQGQACGRLHGVRQGQIEPARTVIADLAVQCLPQPADRRLLPGRQSGVASFFPASHR